MSFSYVEIKYKTQLSIFEDQSRNKNKLAEYFFKRKMRNAGNIRLAGKQLLN